MPNTPPRTPPRPATYARAIPALHLDEELGRLAHLHHDIEAGSEINEANYTNAKILRDCLTAYRRADTYNVTDDVVRQAELRSAAITQEHVNATYGATDLHAVLQAIRNLEHGIEDTKQQLQQDLRRIEALTVNNGIRARNCGTQPDVYRPLQKTVPGHDMRKAEQILSIQGRATRRQRTAQPPLVLPPEPPAVGSLPDNWHENIKMCTLNDIARFALFYNDDFGILDTDAEATAHLKFRDFLTVL
ncbi:hypothetical protein E4T56_gene5045 [Termitomyces sp. T112]|nr:hypothetical protein E4T56_gene5045 [Termitomyces sp. T112]